MPELLCSSYHRSSSFVCCSDPTPLSLSFPVSLSAVSFQNVLKKREKKQKKKKKKKEGNYVKNTNGSYVLNDVVHACVCAEERKGPEQGYQRALFAGDIQMEIDPPATL